MHQPGPHRRSQTLPPRGAGSHDGTPILRRHAHSLSDGSRQQHEDEDAQQPPDGSEAACGMFGRRRRMASLGLVISGSTPPPVVTDKRAMEPRAEAPAEIDVAKRRQERRDERSATPPGAVNTNSVRVKEEGDEEGEEGDEVQGEDSGAGFNIPGGVVKDRKAVLGPRMCERLPSRGDGVTGWGDDAVSPVGGDMLRRRSLRTAIAEASEKGAPAKDQIV